MKKNCTVFLIDDDVDDQEVFALALEEVDQSYTCITSKNAIEAIDQLKQATIKPDYIFLDLNMPRMNGRQCLVEIRNQPQLTSIPVVIYTTSSEARDRDETLALGADAFITKPSAIGELVRALQNIFIHL